MTHIIFFNGWGMDKGVFKHFNTSDDIQITEVNSYHQYHEPTITNDCDRTVVVAWSLGVIMATKFYIQHNLFIDKFIVINGACDGFDKHKGLPKVMSMLTAKRWNTSTLTGFNEKMNGTSEVIVPCNRSIEDQKAELIFLMEHHDEIQSNLLTVNDPCITVLISENEWIYPAKNLIRCWQHQNIVIIKDKFHNPFYSTYSWKQWIEN
ncbi:DUF452 family protein [Halosquirtibacter xylanolyticus]|uniref:pimeloyl-ACP methyl esterase BioG family protein n=1 Tax=Halosquirtibacter xylanolyticus TaxID=3374599 RepID=UPI003748EC75|nr:DUF452 family protein [Prolixibacteraceae bacterium]